jgi:hypothetical protein
MAHERTQKNAELSRVRCASPRTSRVGNSSHNFSQNQNCQFKMTSNEAITPAAVTETIALFGATGATGSHFVKLALEGGYKVTALVRSPEKMEIKNDRLEVIKGSFTVEEDIKKTVSGADYVVSMAGAKLGDPKNYPMDVMLNFVKTLVPIMEEGNVKAFLYQAGAFSYDVNGKSPFMMKVLRSTVGRMIGILPNIEDNDNVIKFLCSTDVKTPYIVTRPGALVEKPAKKELHLVDKPTASSITFADLAKCSLVAIKDESLYGTCRFVA